MILKLVRARAVDRDAFDRAQRRRGPQPGLVAQFGGWSTADDAPDTAVVVALWEDDDAHRRFLAAGHDAYQRDRVPALRERADVAADLASVDGDVVALDPGWRV